MFTDNKGPRRPDKFVIQLDAEAPLPKGDGPWRLADVLPNDELPEEYATLTVTPVYERAGALVERGYEAQEYDRKYRAPDWGRSLLVHAHSTTVKKTLRRIGRSKAIRVAHIMPPSAPPPIDVVVPGNGPGANFDWLRQRPIGIGAEPLWNASGGSDLAGAGARILLVERGVDVAHVDIDSSRVTIDPASVARNLAATDADRQHGLMTLGVLMARSSGSAPPAAEAPVGVASEIDEVLVFCAGPAPTDQDPPDMVDGMTVALTEAVLAGKPGDVLLVELQTYYVGKLVPLEVWDILWQLVKLATTLQITVVLAGANGGVDLDLLPPGPGIVDVNTADSGAVLVAAGQRMAGDIWKRRITSNYGARIDCFAAGDSVTTTASAIGGSLHTYFSDTSAAAAIVAGAAALLQGAKISAGSHLTPTQLRQALHDHGTPCEPAEKIGAMPDLFRTIGGRSLLRKADLVIRDHHLDDGTPHRHQLWRSPDIVVQPKHLPAPPRPADQPLLPIAAGRDQHVYLFAHNRGSRAVPAARATVWFAAPSTLLMPPAWTRLGDVGFPRIAPGDPPVRSTPLVFQSPRGAGAGHFCFIAHLHDAAPPALPPSMTLPEFLDFVGDSNDVAWKNFNVVPVAAGQPVRLPFDVRGATDRGYAFELEVSANLPGGSRLSLHHGGRMITRRQFGADTRRIRRRGAVELDRSGGQLGPSTVPRARAFPMVLEARLPPRPWPARYVVTARQVWCGREVGRVTWVLCVPASCGDARAS